MTKPPPPVIALEINNDAAIILNHSQYDRLISSSRASLRHRLKAANISVPVIYMTGNDGPAVREAAHQSGCVAYLTKPFSAAALADNLQRARQGS
jgi:CheY-like chemotaxis protein